MERASDSPCPVRARGREPVLSNIEYKCTRAPPNDPKFVIS